MALSFYPIQLVLFYALCLLPVGIGDSEIPQHFTEEGMLYGSVTETAMSAVYFSRNHRRHCGPH
ncbi:hypothetical protein IscW_ISCW016332 [Ixodes scapularis]|uniref:Secreted protein n=1 Tax=Ixodes scapularis TaxID=6945 RepID=B7P5S1_IXOSC|nr:hypothetical protein IscW_ISCW016332 [Ixodes scapularis]|eukprot:XP_002407811.1 hypothetical protein IscW_ISCW016332 [Ixodes scapularis]